MANKEYYERWLQIKKDLAKTIDNDRTLQEIATKFIGLKPQSLAVEVVARVYCKYVELYNKICDCYDQMEQVQRRPYIKTVIDAITCRMLELKRTLENVESFEYTYSDNALQQMFMIPHEISILCPFFYPFEIRQQEMQHIMDEIMSGNRLGDPEPTPSELETREQERLEEEQRLQEEKEAEMKRKLAMGEEIVESEPSVVYSPEELEQMRQLAEYNTHVNNIQRMERSRVICREKVLKFNKDANTYLELSGTKAPPPRDDICYKAASLIQMIYRRYMEIKREQLRERKLREKIGMAMPSWVPPSHKAQLEKVKQERRKFREQYYKKWLNENMKEKTRVLRLRENDIMEDISDEIRQWLYIWFAKVKWFDEYPWPAEGGSILIVRGDTMTPEEYADWRVEEEKRIKAAAATPKSKEEIKAEKLAAKAEKKRLEAEAKEREKKRLLDYKKSRLKPENDPGVYITKGEQIDQVTEAWNNYQTQWKDIDTSDAVLDVLRGFLKEIVVEDAYRDVQYQLRPIVDDMMRLELKMLKTALLADYASAQIKNLPLVKKRKKPRVVKPPKPGKITTEMMFQALFDNQIIRDYPNVTLDNFKGDRNYAAADTRTIAWTPFFPPPCIGDVLEQVRTRCLLTLGCQCRNAERSQLLVGPKNSGKKTLIYAVATETKSLLIDLSPMNIWDKFPGPKNAKVMFQYIFKISRVMQPTIIFVDGADKLFYKAVPKEEKMFDPTRLQRDFFKEIIKPLKPEDKILVLGTATEPWLSRGGPMSKVFPNVTLLPRSDYGSISFVFSELLMKYHGVKREVDVHSAAQVARGFDLSAVIDGVKKYMNGDREVQAYHKPLTAVEILSAVMDKEGAVFTSVLDYDMYKQWYLKYSPWGEKYMDLMAMLDSQLQFKLKADKKKKG